MCRRARYCRLLNLGAKISRDDALQIATEECDRRGWPWREPVAAHWRITHWLVVTHVGWQGGNVRIKVGKRDGKVRSAGYIPR